MSSFVITDSIVIKHGRKTAISAVDKQIAAGHLVAPKRLFCETLDMMRELPQTEFMRLTRGMYALAVKQGSWSWVEQAQLNATFLF